MEVNSLKCPNCAGQLLSIHSTKKVCPYCDSEFITGKRQSGIKAGGIIGYTEIVRDICIRTNINNFSVVVGKSLVNSNKFVKAQKYFAIPEEENAFLISDSTVFGNCQKGFAICNTGIYMRGYGSKIHYVKWENFRDVDLKFDPPYDIAIDNIKMYVFKDAGQQLYDLLLEIQDSI